jgi:hypothetical protein
MVKPALQGMRPGEGSSSGSSSGVCFRSPRASSHYAVMSLADALAFPLESLSSPSQPVIDPSLLGDSQDVDMHQADESQAEPEAKEEAEDEEMGDLFGDDA